MPDLEYNTKLYIESLKNVKLNDSVLNKEHYDWALLNLIDQFVRERSGGEMIKFLLRKDLQDDKFVTSTTAGAETQIIRNSHEIEQKKGRLSAILQVLKKIFIPENFSKSGERHKWAYDSYSIGRLLDDSGFFAITILDHESSAIDRFNYFHLDADTEGIVYKPNSLFVECKKRR